MCCLVLGGGTRTGFLSDTLAQLIALPLLLTALWGAFDQLSVRGIRGALLFCGALALVPIVQLVVLPPSIWTALPNRASELATLELLGNGVPWMPISVSPHATALSALSLIPPVAVFLSVVQLDSRQRRMLSVVVLTMGALSVFLGLNQVAQGPDSALRFFEITNPTEAVGFFANRNHFAALLYVLTPFAAAWAVEAAVVAARDWRKFDAQTLRLVASLILLVMLIAGQAMARSRAGLLLTIIAMFAGFALAFTDRRTRSGMTPVQLLGVALAVAIVLSMQFALYRVLERFTSDPLQDARPTFTRLTTAAAKAYMPVGSGMGTFSVVYPTVEKPQDTLENTYVNRAHNDVAELWLESGVMGLALMLVFVVWLAAAALKAWRKDEWGDRDIDRLLVRAASVGITLVIVHSFFDYPLRTCAIMTIMAFACGLLFEPAPVLQGAAAGHVHARSRRPTHDERTEPSLTGPRPPAIAEVEPAHVAPPAPPAARRPWGGDVQWPEEWRKPAKPPKDKTPGS